MQPGELDQRIVIQAESRTADAYGGAALAWTDLATVWAKARPVSGRERLAGGAVSAPALYRFTIRRRSDVTEGMRVMWNSRAFNVRFIGDAGVRDGFMSLEAEAGVAT